MRRWIVAAFMVVAAVSGYGCLEGKDPVLAKVGQHAIRTSDYIDQYRNISPQFRPDLGTIEKKEAFLRTLVQRDLLLAEARSSGLDSEVLVHLQIEDARKKILLPESFKDVIAKRPEPGVDELASLSRALSYRYHLHVLMSTDPEPINEAHRALQTGKPWRQLEQSWSSDPPGVRSGDKGLLPLDGFPEQLRNEVIELTPGSWSGVVEYGGVQHLIYLEGREPDPAADSTSVAERAKNLWNHDWEERAVKAHVDVEKRRRNWKLQDVVIMAFAARFAAMDSTHAWPEFGEQRKAELVTWDGGHVTVGDILDRIEQQPEVSRPSFADVARTRSMVTSLGDEEIMLSAAESTGLASRPDIAQKLRRAEDQILLDKVIAKVAADAKPTDKEMNDYYEANKEQFKVNAERHVYVIVVPDSARARELYVELRKGADFGPLARANSTHESAAAGGDLGWVSPDHMPELLPIVTNAPVNSPVTPRRALGGWAVFRIPETRGTRIASLAEMHDLIAGRVKPLAQDRMLTEWVEGKMKEGAKLYPKRLARVVIPADLLPAPGEGAPGDTAHAAEAAGAPAADSHAGHSHGAEGH